MEERPLSLIPVGLKEAALDSPTFRATTSHFSDQIDFVERWLEGYVKAATKLVSEVADLEAVVNSYLTHSAVPTQLSEAVLDHDYTMLALKRYSEGAREFWQYTLRGIRKYDNTVIDPIKHFLNNELKTFKETKRNLETCQKAFDRLIAQYASQGKTKEASSLREDAFQLYEGRRAYLKAGMDFCTAAPQLRATLDKLLVNIFAEQWKEMRSAREANASLFVKWSSEMDRVRGWSKEMVDSERAFQRELLMARRQIEENAEELWRPSRELEDYNISTAPFIAPGTASGKGAPGRPQREKQEKQGWLFQKTLSGKPARTVWVRRWFFVRNGIFGWLINGTRSGGVEESDKIGVLLCSIRPAASEERRFCFEVKTKDNTVTLQAETQSELTDWITAFEMVKRKALGNPASTESQSASGIDPAFAVSPPIAPDFAVRTDDRYQREISEEQGGLAVPQSPADLQHRSSFDVTAMRKASGSDKDGDTTSRLMSRLDLHKKSVQSAGPSGGIASLISASHNVLPVSPGVPVPPTPTGDMPRRKLTIPNSSLAPSTLANPPALTNLSHAAVSLSTERGPLSSKVDGSDISSGVLANLWGSSNWGRINRIGDELSDDVPQKSVEFEAEQGEGLTLARLSHRKTLSATTDAGALVSAVRQEDADDTPKNYPPALKAQNAQFRLLFPTVPHNEKVVLVFHATWNPNELQEFPGRVYVTTKEVYFYSHHLGFVLTTGTHLSNVTDVTSAPGRDCDFVYLHLRESTRLNAPKRITIKTFLEPLKLLRRRLNYLVRNASSEHPDAIEDVVRMLLKMESEPARRTSSIDSWEDVNYSPIDESAGGAQAGSEQSRRDMKASLRIDGNLYGETTARTGKEVQRFRLPAQPVRYAPQGMQNAVSRDFQVSAKALFHVIFGDKSTLFQLLYCNRWGNVIEQSPWIKSDGGQFTRRIESKDKTVQSEDVQTIDVITDHLCYVVTNVKQPWRLPYPDRQQLITKIVITHSAKSRCKLAIFQQVRWARDAPPTFLRRLVEREALNSLEADALDLTNVAMDQTAKLGNHSRTNKAVEIFGNIGQHKVVVEVDAIAAEKIAPKSLKVNKQKVKVTLLGLIVDDTVIRIGNGLTTLVDLVVGAFKAVINLCTSHSLLVLLLLASTAFNSWHGYKDSLSWYHDRNAGKFMNRLGISPAPVMAKTVYLQDIEDMIAQPAQLLNVTSAYGNASDHKTCQTTFTEQMSDFSVRQGGASRRLHQTRDALGRYRHDLLVALRLINRVERDVVQTEWHGWARLEDARCRRVQRLLQPESDAGKQSKDSPDQKKSIDLGESFDAYCQSCRVATDQAGQELTLL